MKRNRLGILLGFMAAAAVVHVIIPPVTGNGEVYLVTMPLPWGTSGLQLLLPGRQSPPEGRGRGSPASWPGSAVSTSPWGRG